MLICNVNSLSQHLSVRMCLLLSPQIHTEATTVGGETFKGPEYKVIVTVKGGIPLAMALGVAFGIMIFVVIVLIAAFCIWKRRNPAYLQVVRMPDGTGEKLKQQ